MNRRQFLKGIGAAELVAILPSPKLAFTASAFRRCRPSDPDWPSPAAWKELQRSLSGDLIPVNFPLSVLKTAPDSPSARALYRHLSNPFYIRDQPGLTQTLGWLEAWTTSPSVYAVAARNAHDVASAVTFARENRLRLAIKGGGHSYQGTSNAPDSLLIWTRYLDDITIHDAFVPQGCAAALRPQPAVTIGAGTIWMQVYDAVTTRNGRYVQGGGCTTVGVAGLIQSGGFGSFSKHYGLAAAGLLEAEIVTADGQIRIANECTNADLFWALKGGGGGTFGVMTRVTLRIRELPEYFGIASFTVRATSENAYKRLIREFLSFYGEGLFNHCWGEQVSFNRNNSIAINMVSYGLDSRQAEAVWQPFLGWVARSREYFFEGRRIIASWPARHMWDVSWWKKHWPELIVPNPRGGRLLTLISRLVGWLYEQPVFDIDERPGASPQHAWWVADASQVGWFIWGFDSLWLPSSLLASEAQAHLADALFAGSRYSTLSLHFNKGLAGAPAEAIAEAHNTAINPQVFSAFALAIAAEAQGPAYPGIGGHEPAISQGRIAAQHVNSCMSRLRALVPQAGSYVSESDYFEKDWQRSYWGSNYARLAEIKRKYDPEGLFFVHNGVGSERWSTDGFTRR